MDSDDEELTSRPTGYRRHNTQPYANTMWHAAMACRAALGTYILSHRSESQTKFAQRAGVPILALRSIEYGQEIDSPSLRAVTKAISNEIDAEAAKELRLLYKALSRCIARLENADAEEVEDDA